MRCGVGGKKFCGEAITITIMRKHSGHNSTPAMKLCTGRFKGLDSVSLPPHPSHLHLVVIGWRSQVAGH